MEGAGDLQLLRTITDNRTGHFDCSATKACLLSDGRVDVKLNKSSKRKRLLAHFSTRSEKCCEDGASFVSPVDETGEPRPPPTMDIVIQAVGSRGDIQPFVALGLALKQAGHRVRIATHPSFEGFVKDHGLQFFSIGGDPKRLMAYMVKNPGLLPSLHSIREGDIQENRADIREILDGCWRSCFEQIEPTEEERGRVTRPFRANAIIANPPSFAHVHCAEKMGIPLHLMFTMPWSPTQVFPHPLANVHPSSFEPKVSNYLSYALVEILTWEGLGGVINKFRRQTLGLKPLDRSSGPNLIAQLSIPYTYCWSPTLIPKPEDWAAHISISGFYFLPEESHYTPPPDLESFLNTNQDVPVIYIGFGSIVVEDPKSLTRLLLQAIEQAGPVRALVSQGWSNLGGDESAAIPSNVYLLGNCPHDWIFKRVSCVVHHGGAGTTAAAVAAGKPSVVVPFFGDQPFWGRMVERAGAGPPPIGFKKLTAQNLAAAIRAALEPETLERAQLLGRQVNQESGVDMGVESFYQHIRKARMRCCIGPQHSAMWAIRRTDVRLGNMAAAALIDMGLLDFEKIELMRPCSYDLNIGPRDPFTGIALAMVDVASDSVAGLDRFACSMGSLFGPNGTNTKSPEEEAPGKWKVVGTGLGGLGKASVAVIRMPVQVGMAVTQGLHNMPKIWSDRKVRPQRTVENVPTGIKAGFQVSRTPYMQSEHANIGKELFYGTYDGVSSLFMSPIEGSRQNGLTGGLTGMCSGVLSGASQSISGLTAVITYPLKGIDVDLGNRFAKHQPSAYDKFLLQQGLAEIKQMPASNTSFLLSRWHQATANVKKSKLRKKKWQRTEVEWLH